jgi:hypothetical protein
VSPPVGAADGVGVPAGVGVAEGDGVGVPAGVGVDGDRHSAWAWLPLCQFTAVSMLPVRLRPM